MFEVVEARGCTMSQRLLDGFARDGVVVLRGVVRDRELLSKLDREVWNMSNAFEFDEYGADSWLYSRGMRALLMSRTYGLAELLYDTVPTLPRYRP